MHTFHFFQELMNIPSPSGEENQIASFLLEYLDKKGFYVEPIDVPKGSFNVYAYHGDPCVVMSTHMDTVRPLIPFSEDKRYFYGRGACDAKGILAAQVMAAEKLMEMEEKNFGLLFLVEEESESNGARTANKFSNTCKYLINGEPTDNRLALGSKGSIRLDIHVKGKAAHSAYPEQGISAIDTLISILNDLKKTRFPSHRILGKTTMNIGVIEGGSQYNVISDRAVAKLMFRTVTEHDQLKRKVESAVGGRGEIEYHLECQPVFLEKVSGFDTTVVSFTTDIPNLTNWGKPFLIGPGSILDAHTSNEKISKKELSRAVELYVKLVVQLLKKC